MPTDRTTNADLIPLAELGVTDPSMLPDWLLGHQEIEMISTFQAAGGTAWFASHMSLPRQIVLLSISIQPHSALTYTYLFRFATAHVLPTTAAEMTAQRPIGFRATRNNTQDDRGTFTTVNAPLTIPCRRLLDTDEGYFIVETTTPSGIMLPQFIFVWAPAPTAIPRWAARYLRLLD